VQSFQVEELKVLGRSHSVEEISKSYQLAREVSFTNISIDLMYGLPKQTLGAWQKNLRQAVQLGPEHISLYQLHLEENTPLYSLWEKRQLAEFDDGLAREMYDSAIDYLTNQGYGHYEISNFAQPGRESKHNQLYWRNEEYLGLGAGASGYLQGIRYTNVTSLEAYSQALKKGDAVVVREEITPELFQAETMFLGLRLTQGVAKEVFLKRHGVSLRECYGEVIDKLEGQGLLEDRGTHVALTRQGLYLANEVFMEFLP
jgi:oxygen-independent coproporphyrinogen-3 oxidase